MAIASEFLSNIPFQFKVIKGYPYKQVQFAHDFSFNENELLQGNKITFKIEEHDDVDIQFNCDDRNARLYFDAIDFTSSHIELDVDEEGRAYLKPSARTYCLSKSDGSMKPLRIGVFRMMVICDGIHYFGTIEVSPKPMTVEEWSMMKDDLENEAVGLARDIINRNYGLGLKLSINMLPKNDYYFLVIEKYAKVLLYVLSDIAEKPLCHTKFQYKSASISNCMQKDKNAIKYYLQKNGSQIQYKLPIRTADYDIQENRIVKRILIFTEKIFDDCMCWLQQVQQFLLRDSPMEDIAYQNEIVQSISELFILLSKIKKVIVKIKEKEWYRCISTWTDKMIPNSFLFDSRYHMLYQMYEEFRRPNPNLVIDPQIMYSWKYSSYLYEMWCYIKVCRLLQKRYLLENGELDELFMNDSLIKYMKPGMCSSFSDDLVVLKVFFDAVLPDRNIEETDGTPLYISRSYENRITHNRPDMIIHIYSKKYNCYAGSIILECKYRKLNSFWDESSERSSQEQFQTYYSNAKSEKIYGKFGKMLDIRPVRKVIVLTPDLMGKNKEKQDYHTIVKALKPSRNTEMMEDLFLEINHNIDQCIEVCEVLNHKLDYDFIR